MPKPILVVKIPNLSSDENYDKIGSDLSEIPGLINDYYILIVKNDRDASDFKVFYEKDFDEIKYEELKKIIENAIHSNNTRAAS